MEKEFTSVQCDMGPIFLKALADNQVINEEELSSEKLSELYGPLKERVNESITKQENCLAEVEVDFTDFLTVFSANLKVYLSACVLYPSHDLCRHVSVME